MITNFFLRSLSQIHAHVFCESKQFTDKHWEDSSLTKLKTVQQGSHRLEKYLNLEGFLKKSLKIKSALKSTGKSLKSLEKSLNSTIICRT